jgi:hypothetical protein
MAGRRAKRPPWVHVLLRAGRPPWTLSDSRLLGTPLFLASDLFGLKDSLMGFAPTCLVGCWAHIKAGRFRPAFVCIRFFPKLVRKPARKSRPQGGSGRKSIFGGPRPKTAVKAETLGERRLPNEHVRRRGLGDGVSPLVSWTPHSATRRNVLLISEHPPASPNSLPRTRSRFSTTLIV